MKHSNFRGIATVALLSATPNLASPCVIPQSSDEIKSGKYHSHFKPVDFGTALTQCTIQIIRTVHQTQVSNVDIHELDVEDMDFSDISFNDLYRVRKHITVDVVSVKKGEFNLSL